MIDLVAGCLMDYSGLYMIIYRFLYNDLWQSLDDLWISLPIFMRDYRVPDSQLVYARCGAYPRD